MKDVEESEGLFTPFSNMKFMNDVVENRLIMEDSYGNKVQVMFRPGAYKQAIELCMKNLIEKQNKQE